MKAKMKPHKLLSMLLALVMVVGMLPAMGQVAYAYSAGDIAGTTGSGASEADPVVCDTFAEFKAAMENEDIRFVKLTGTIETIPAQEDLSAAIDQSSPKTLIVEGKNTFIGSMNGRINCLLYVHSELNVKGSGTLEYSHGMGAGAGAVIYGLSKCSLTIQDVTLVGSINGQTFGRALYLAGDSKTKILSGTFSGYSESTVDAYNTISAVSVNELAELTIEDGSFYSTAGADSIKTYGLDINKATTKVTLNGGTYDGIDASDANLNLSDMLGTDRYSGFIFKSRYNTVLSPHCVNRAIDRIIKACNTKEEEDAKAEGREPELLPHFSCHHLRHTFCTRFCENETNLKVIQEIMGHADITTTMDIYNEATKDKKIESFAGLEGKIKIR